MAMEGFRDFQYYLASRQSTKLRLKALPKVFIHHGQLINNVEEGGWGLSVGIDGVRDFQYNTTSQQSTKS